MKWRSSHESIFKSPVYHVHNEHESESSSDLSKRVHVALLAAPRSGTFSAYIISTRPLAYWRLGWGWSCPKSSKEIPFEMQIWIAPSNYRDGLCIFPSHHMHGIKWKPPHTNNFPPTHPCMHAKTHVCTYQQIIHHANKTCTLLHIYLI